MLVIGINSEARAKRPKHFPMNKWRLWVVIDTEAKKRVYGPESRDACERYVRENE